MFSTAHWQNPRVTAASAALGEGEVQCCVCVFGCCLQAKLFPGTSTWRVQQGALPASGLPEGCFMQPGARASGEDGMSSFPKSALQLPGTGQLSQQTVTPQGCQRSPGTLWGPSKRHRDRHTLLPAPAPQQRAGRETGGFPELCSCWSDHRCPGRAPVPPVSLQSCVERNTCLAGVEKGKVEVPAFMGFGNS